MGVPFNKNPEKQRKQYFYGKPRPETWPELLCCPGLYGTNILDFDPASINGGTTRYQLKPRISHCEEVPRYQLYLQENREHQLVGHMEKSESHLRAKPGEFLRVQVWHISANTLTTEKRRSPHGYAHLCLGIRELPTPTTTGMEKVTMVIAVQGKMKRSTIGTTGQILVDREGEAWKTTISVDHGSREYAAVVSKKMEDGHSEYEGAHPTRSSMDTLKIFRTAKGQGNRKDGADNPYPWQCVATAKKKYFVRSVNYGQVQPYLGVKLLCQGKRKQLPGKHERVQSAASTLTLAVPKNDRDIDIEGLLLLMMCLAWSEETIWTEHDIYTEKFEAMMAGLPDAAVQWDTTDVANQLKKYPFARLHNWRDDADDLVDTSESDSENENALGFGGASVSTTMMTGGAPQDSVDPQAAVASQAGVASQAEDAQAAPGPPPTSAGDPPDTGTSQEKPRLAAGGSTSSLLLVAANQESIGPEPPEPQQPKKHAFGFHTFLRPRAQ